MEDILKRFEDIAKAHEMTVEEVLERALFLACQVSRVREVEHESYH